MNRKNFISSSIIASAAAFFGAKIVVGENPLESKESVNTNPIKAIQGKHEELIILNPKPWNAETPPHLLDDKITPADRLFVRNNGIIPKNIDVNNWTLTIEGESTKTKKTYTLKELKSKFKHYSYQLTLECGGNGRKEFSPPAKGNQWDLGAVGCPKWTGVRLKDVLNDAGMKSDAVYIGYYGKDTHLTGDLEKVVISRGVPIKKALEDEALIAWAINGEDLPVMNGYPLRLVFGGWPASTSGKWLSKIVVRNKIHDGPKMGGYSYRIPKYPVAPGTKVPVEDMKIIEEMPVKSLITYPKTGALIKGTKIFEVRGHAWAGDLSIKDVSVSLDFGVTWKKCKLSEAVNKNAWQHFNIKVFLPQKGYYEIWAKAIDSNGEMQPMVVPNWNPKGYLNNACHRIAVKRI
ncbi:MAG: sulfite oxidase [Flavobacteriales bacterium]|nr:sulfite oxidase [Flavobacteriales bacterium]